MSIVSGTHGALLPICPPQPLPTYLHTCGQPIQLGQRMNGYALQPLFWIPDIAGNLHQHIICPICRQILRTPDLHPASSIESRTP
jgi:hypothetical protein